MHACLVTGATGFIGRRLCKQLKNSGWHVRAVMRKQVDGPWDEYVIANFEGETLPQELCRGIDTVFHLAGKAHAVTASLADESSYARINVEGTRKLLELAHRDGVRRFVFISSVKVMGEHGAGEDETSVAKPETAYGCSKRDAERLVLEGGYVTEPVVLRLSMVYGPTRKGNLPRMIEAVAKRRFPPLPDTHNKRSMVHVDDVVQAAIKAAEHPAAVGEIYLVTDGRTYSTREIYEWICAALGRQVPGWHLPLSLLRLMAWAGDGVATLLGRRFVFDSDALEKLLGSSWYDSTKIERELMFAAKRNLHEAIKEMISLSISGA